MKPQQIESFDQLQGFVSVNFEASAMSWPEPDERAQLSLASNPITIVNLQGVMRKGGWSCDTDYVTEAVLQAGADDECQLIYINADSPGGDIAGVGRLSKAVAEVAKIKPIIVYAPDMLASAAYWACAGATRIFAGRTAYIGSCAVMKTITDESEALKKDGIKPIRLSSGELKAPGSGGSKVTKDQIENEMQGIATIAAEMRADINAGRKLPEDTNVWKGGLFVGEDAFTAGLIDGICEPDEVLKYIAKLLETP